jgi:Cof subfamily protein (haloacid dehalogenase superfamily)
LIFKPKRLYKIIFLDIDGTLIKSDHTISEATIDIIQKLKENQILVVLVSARPIHGMIKIAEEAGLQGFPAVSLNGALIFINEKVVFESVIEINVTRRIYDYLKQYHTTPIFYNQHSWFSEMPDYHTRYEQKITDVPITIESFNNTIQYWQKQNSGPNKILVISEESEINEIKNNLTGQFSDRLNILTSKQTYLEIMNREASKLTAVKYLLKQFNLNREEAIAIGDHFNDKEMIQFAGMGIAMGNSPDEVKVAADYVTDTNNHDGVFKAIQHIMQL